MSYSVTELTIGQFASFSKTISESDIYLFAGITGDTNPAHLNEEYAQDTFFKGRIAHGMLSASLLCAVLGMQLPGPGTIHISQTVAFKAPVYPGDTVTASAEVIDVNPDKNLATLHTKCTNQHGKVVLEGDAVVKPPLKRQKSD